MVVVDFLAEVLEAAVERAGALAFVFVVVFLATGFAAGLVSFLTVALTGLFCYKVRRWERAALQSAC